MKKNTSKIENKGISVLRNLIDNMDCVTHSFGENNTEISWDGDIKLYKNPDVDDKGNLSSIIRVQVKSRTKKIPSGNSMNYFINKKDLNNYLIENGTMYFVIIFNKNNEFKIFYIDLLPYNLRKLLKEEVNGKNEIKENEETLINMQALEAILAYDENKNKKLLEYANFLLDKIINIESMHEIAIINKCQIKKRLGKLTLDDKFELMKIFEKKKDNLIYSISINLLIDKKEDAKKELENLTEYEKEEYLKYPISIFLN